MNDIFQPIMPWNETYYQKFFLLLPKWFTITYTSLSTLMPLPVLDSHHSKGSDGRPTQFTHPAYSTPVVSLAYPSQAMSPVKVDTLLQSLQIFFYIVMTTILLAIIMYGHLSICGQKQDGPSCNTAWNWSEYAQSSPSLLALPNCADGSCPTLLMIS